MSNESKMDVKKAEAIARRPFGDFTSWNSLKESAETLAAEVERLRKRLRLSIGRNRDIPWTEVSVDDLAEETAR